MKKLRTPLIIFFFFTCLSLSYQIRTARIPSAPGTLLTLVELPPYPAQDILYHDYWVDFLQYCDGYEILVVRTRENLTAQLNTWTHVSSITLEEIEPLVPADLYIQQMKENCPDLPTSYTAYFLPSFEGNAASCDDEFFIGLYDAKTRICLVYRGHHLYSL